MKEPAHAVLIGQSAFIKITPAKKTNLKQKAHQVSSRKKKDTRKGQKAPGLLKRPTKARSSLTTNPLVLSRNMGVGTPQYTAHADGSITVRFRELVRPQLEKITTFSDGLTNYPGIYINPGLSDSFPWLSTLAANYDQYEVHRIHYEYVPGLSASTTGFMYMVPDYDVTDTEPLGIQQLANQMGAVSTPVWSPINMQVRKKAAMSVGPRRFIRQANTASDNRLSDVAVVRLASSGLTGGLADVLPCQVWVSYEITLSAPQILVSRGSTIGATRTGTKSYTLSNVFTFPQTTIAASGDSPVIVDNTSAVNTNNGLGFMPMNLGMTVPDVAALFGTKGNVPNQLEVSFEPRGHLAGSGAPLAAGSGGILDYFLVACDKAGNPLPDQGFIKKSFTNALVASVSAAANQVPFVGKALSWIVDEVAGKRLNNHTGSIHYCLRNNIFRQAIYGAIATEAGFEHLGNLDGDLYGGLIGEVNVKAL